MKRAKIVALLGTWGSNIAQLIVVNEEGRPELILCENAPTVRALASCFPNDSIITDGHRVNNEALTSKVIRYQTDELGLLEFIAPAEELTTEKGA